MVKLYYATLPGVTAQQLVLDQLGIRNVLVSNFYVQQAWSSHDFKRYVKTGLPPGIKDKKEARHYLERPVRRIFYQNAARLRARRLNRI